MLTVLGLVLGCSGNPGQEPGGSPAPSTSSAPPVVVAPNSTAPSPIPTATPPSTRELLEQISAPNLEQHLVRLQAAGGNDPLRGSRMSCTPGNLWAADYLGEQLQAMGLEVVPPESSSFTVRLHDGRTCQSRNVVATLAGRDPRLYLVTGHYDSINTQSPGFRGPRTDQPAPGADDNGTGIAALLEIARVLAAQPAPSRTIRFIAFGGEENSPNFQGSALYAQQARQSGEDIAGVYNIDMIGHNPVCDKTVAGASTGAEQALVQALVTANQVYRLELLIEQQPEGSSDHVSFRNQGYPAIILTENYGFSASGPCAAFSPQYHHTTDVYDPSNPERINNINLRQVRKVAQVVLAALLDLAYL